MFPFFLLRRESDFKYLSNGLAVMAVLSALILIFLPTYDYHSEAAQKYMTRRTVLGTDPLNAAFFISLGATVMSIRLLRKASFFSVIYLLGLSISLYAMYLTGSRSMFLQVFLSLLLASLLMKSKYAKIIGGVFFVFLITMPMWVTGFDMFTQNTRILNAIDDPLSVLVSSNRLPMWTYVLTHWSNSPFIGQGIGSFAVDFFNLDMRRYPHNYFLEVLYELGLFGLVLFLSFLASYMSAMKGFIKRQRRFDNEIIWVSLSLGILGSTIFHWDISDLRHLWLMMSIALSAVLLSKNSGTGAPFKRTRRL